MKNLIGISSLVLLISFFLPWTYFFTSISGFDIAFHSSEFVDITEDGGIALLLYGLFTIPVLSIITLMGSFQGKDVKKIGVITGIIPLLYFLYFFVQSDGLYEALGFGAYLTILSALVLVISPFIGTLSQPVPTKTESNETKTAD